MRETAANDTLGVISFQDRIAGDPERRRHVFQPRALRYHLRKGHKLIGRVHGLMLDILRQRNLGNVASVCFDQTRHRIVIGYRLLLGQCGRCDRLTGLHKYADHLYRITLTSRLLKKKLNHCRSRTRGRDLPLRRKSRYP